MEIFMEQALYISQPNSDSPKALCLPEHFYSKGVQSWEAIYYSVICFMKQIFFSIPSITGDCLRTNTLSWEHVN